MVIETTIYVQNKFELGCKFFAFVSNKLVFLSTMNTEKKNLFHTCVFVKVSFSYFFIFFRFQFSIAKLQK